MIGCKWVFALKRDEHGNIARYKARLVDLGFLQTYRIDYSETYSPIASLNTVRVFLAVCCSRNYVVKQYDIETAFLNRDLDEEVYMAVPSGIKTSDGMVCRLRRSLYGLKQAAAVWYKKIREVFLRMGFQQCGADVCLFVKESGEDGPVFIVLYVDDLLIGCKNDEIDEEVTKKLAEHFTVKTLGDA